MHFDLPVKSLIWILTTVLIVAVLTSCQSGSSQSASPAPQATAAAAQEESAGEEETVAEASATATEESTSTVGGELQTFTIDPEQSEARFLIDEVLLGSDNTVVGVTSQVSGEVRVDPADPSRTEIGTISVDARDLTTDSSRRNRSIQRFILRSAAEENRYITFEPTTIDGLSAEAVVGEPFDFSVIGDLTVRGTTLPVTFNMTVTANSEIELTGLGTTTILYSDFGISIPSVPAVASVEDEVRLEIEFIANAD